MNLNKIENKINNFLESIYVNKFPDGNIMYFGVIKNGEFVGFLSDELISKIKNPNNYEVVSIRVSIPEKLSEKELLKACNEYGSFETFKFLSYAPNKKFDVSMFKLLTLDAKEQYYCLSILTKNRKNDFFKSLEKQILDWLKGKSQFKSPLSPKQSAHVDPKKDIGGSKAAMFWRGYYSYIQNTLSVWEKDLNLGKLIDPNTGKMKDEEKEFYDLIDNK